MKANNKEKMSKKTLVERKIAMPAKHRIAHAELNSVLMDSGRFGYDYQADQNLPEIITAKNIRSMDITEKMELKNHVLETIKSIRRDRLQNEQPQPAHPLANRQSAAIDESNKQEQAKTKPVEETTNTINAPSGSAGA